MGGAAARLPADVRKDALVAPCALGRVVSPADLRTGSRVGDPLAGAGTPSADWGPESPGEGCAVEKGPPGAAGGTPDKHILLQHIPADDRVTGRALPKQLIIEDASIRGVRGKEGGYDSLVLSKFEGTVRGGSDSDGEVDVPGLHPGTKGGDGPGWLLAVRHSGWTGSLGARLGGQK